MNLQFLTVVLLLFAASSNAAINPSMSINNDPVCDVYKSAYVSKLTAGSRPTFYTEEIP